LCDDSIVLVGVGEVYSGRLRGNCFVDVDFLVVAALSRGRDPYPDLAPGDESSLFQVEYLPPEDSAKLNIELLPHDLRAESLLIYREFPNHMAHKLVDRLAVADTHTHAKPQVSTSTRHLSSAHLKEGCLIKRGRFHIELGRQIVPQHLRVPKS